MDLIQRVQQIGRNFKQGFRTADVLQRRDYAETTQQGGYYGESLLDPKFKRSLAGAGVTARQTPAQFAGAYTNRLLIDLANDGTRTHWWRWNHPLAIAQKLVEVGVDPSVVQSPSARALTTLGIAAPAVAAAGAYDITNLGELGRPKGFAQSYAGLGSDDRRKTEQPGQELFERFFLSRTGRPLKYETAKKDIPDLTPQRYGNYMKFLYQDKGLLDLGVVKGTMENLQGVPEVRMLGYPVTLPTVAGFAGGPVSATIAGRTGKTPAQRAVRAIAGGLAGSAGGVGLGNVVNQQIAAANRPKLPTTQQYQDLSAGRI
jgi:hypothetical protein